MPVVNHEILRWARENAGLDRDTAARKIALHATKERSASERLEDIESGSAPPSRKLLVEMARHYHRPLLMFYLDRLPERGERGEDFRALTQAPAPVESGLLDALLRDVRARQGIVRAALEAEEEGQLLPFIGSRSLDEGIESVAKSIAGVLRFSLERFRSSPSPDAAFAYLRDLAEESGVFVLLKSDLGSHHTSLDTEIFRGFALADPIAPFVVLNNQDTRAAWSFTLLHELAHLWLGSSGVSGEIPDNRIEKFSNDVASEILLPRTELSDAQISDADDFATCVAFIDFFARERRVSSSMVAYAFFRARRISKERWRDLAAHYRNLWSTERIRQKERNKSREGGPNANVVLHHQLGKRLVSTTERMLRSGALSTSKAGIVLGVKGKRVEAIIAATPEAAIRD